MTRAVEMKQGRREDQGRRRRKRAIKFEPEMFMSLNGLKNNPWSKKKNKVESYANLEN